MASIQDVADQINGKLDTINANTQATAANTAQTVTLLQDLRQEARQTNARLDNLADGLFALLEVQRAALALLDHHRRQNDTIICELVNNNDLLCGMTRKLTDLVDTGHDTLTAVWRLEAIAERVHPGPAADYDRALETERRIEACCPPDEERPEPCPPSCEVPRFDPPRPQGQNWTPPADKDRVG